MLLRLTRLSVVLAALAAVLSAGLHAQDGSNDPSFNRADDGTYGIGASWQVDASLLQPDGKLVIAGGFGFYNSVARKSLARVNPDGSLDPTLQTAPGPVGPIVSVARQPDGKLIVAGGLTTYDAVPRIGIARVNSDGRLDPSFDPGAGPQDYGYVQSVALQPDGKLIVGGWFTSFDGAPRKYVARLNADGSVDPSFDSSNGANTVVTCVLLQSDGKILIGGHFTHYGGVSRNRIARLNSDGSLDTSFDPGLGALGHVLAIALQPDGKVVIGGDFNSIGAVPRRFLARLHPNGALDLGFDPGAGPSGRIHALTLQSDGRLLIGGYIQSYQGAPRNSVARLMPDGALDTSFTPPSGSTNAAFAMHQLANGKVLVSGDISDWDGFERNGVVRLEPDGALDTSFNPLPAPGDFVRQVLPQSDGKTVVLGAFDYYANIPREKLARIESDGALDASYDPQSNGGIQVAALQADDKLLVAGTFTALGGTARTGLARLEVNGSVDTSFDAGAVPLGGIRAIAVQPDGRVLVAGSFTTFNGVARGRIARLETNGALDLSFDPLSGVGSYYVNDIALQPDGGIVIGGNFQSVGGLPRRCIARLKPGGQLDTGFAPNPGANDSVSEVVLQPDGKILIGGYFTWVNGVTRRGLARLNADGSLDSTFASGAGLLSGTSTSGQALAIALQPDHKILIAGSFQTVMGQPLRSIARLHTDGNPDLEFRGFPGVGGSVNSMTLDANGRALIGGSFLSYDGAIRHRIARLIAYSPEPLSYCTAGTSTNGCAPTMEFDGSPSLSKSNGFRLDVSNLDGQRQTLLFYGVGGRRAEPWAAGSTSYLCVRAPIQRVLSASSGGAAGACDGAVSVDWLDYIANNPAAVGAPFAAGVAVNAQAWYRDPPAPRSTNLSDALEFVTRP